MQVSGVYSVVWGPPRLLAPVPPALKRVRDIRAGTMSHWPLMRRLISPFLRCAWLLFQWCRCRCVHVCMCTCVRPSLYVPIPGCVRV